MKLVRAVDRLDLLLEKLEREAEHWQNLSDIRTRKTRKRRISPGPEDPDEFHDAARLADQIKSIRSAIRSGSWDAALCQMFQAGHTFALLERRGSLISSRRRDDERAVGKYQRDCTSRAEKANHKRRQRTEQLRTRVVEMLRSQMRTKMKKSAVVYAVAVEAGVSERFVWECLRKSISQPTRKSTARR